VGRRITVDGTAREIIGVLPAGFWFMDVQHDLLLPLRFERSKVRLAGYNFQAIGRLRPGVSVEAANADVARMIRIEMGKFPPPEGMSVTMLEDARLGPNVRPLINDVVGDVGKSLWVVMATIGIVLLIACANIANLLLVRTEGRARELAVRAALGAGRGRLAKELLVESVLLGLIGGAGAIGVALAGLKLVLSTTPARLPRLESIAVDATSMVFTLILSVAAGLAVGAIPVLRPRRADVADALRAGGRSASAGRERNVTRNTLTVVQVALAVVLLIGSGLMIRTFQSMRRVETGFTEPGTLQTMRIAITGDVAADDTRLLALQQELTNSLASLPGVSSVGLMNGLPMTGFESQDPIFASDRSYAANTIPPLRRFIRTAPGTFRTLGTPLAAGRDYEWADLQQKRAVVLISENFAREYWGSAAAAIGKRIRENSNEEWSEVIGVVGDIRHDGVDRPPPSTVYWPLRGVRSATFLIRGPRAGTEGYTADLRRAVSALSGALPITRMQTLQQVYDKSMARTAFTLTLLGLSGGMALLLAAIGIYAVIAYTIAQRTREIGIRLALGARQGRLQLTFVGHGVLWSAIGAAAGLAAAVPLSQLMSALLFDVAPVDPLTYAAVAFGSLAAAAVAGYVPARRLTRIHPIEALRAE
jgi:predicted permease